MPTTKEVVPCFSSIDELQAGLAAKAAYASIDLYPRDGSERLALAEAQAGHLARVEDHEIALFNSGMSAVVAAVDVALEQSETHTPVLACAEQLYSQTGAYIGQRLTRRGVKVVRFDSSWPIHVQRVLEQHQPDVILSETVGNGPGVPVLDTEALLDQAKSLGSKPVVVLDNTLPLSTGLPLGNMLPKDDNVLVAESGTKSYTFNSELSGLVYSKNQSLLDKVREYRRMTGSMPGIKSVEGILSLLPDSREAFDDRNKRIYKNTGALALALFEAQANGGDFIVSHPSLPSHDNYDYAAQNYPDGASPVLFLQCTGCADQFELAGRIWQNESVQTHAKLGQSFGFDHARILPDERGRVVRIAGGAYTDTEALGQALAEASLNR